MLKTVQCVDIDGVFYTVPVTELKWRPSAYGIVIKDNCILLSPQFGENSYDLPGGGLVLGESPEEAVIREAKEETGLEVANPKLLAIKSSFFKFGHADGDVNQSLMMYYQCDFVGGELSTDGFDDYEKEYARLAVWFPIDQLDSIKVASSIDWREFVRKVAA